ncbi:MAG TPA: LPS assembly lipoprotein LptE [Gammaproteobacteria bacterium]
MFFCRLIFFLTVASLLTACGFHLRGSPELAGNRALPAEMAVTVIEAPSQTSELVRQLKRALRSAEVVVADAEDQPGAARLSLSEELDRRVLSVDSEGRAVEYELNYTVTFQVSRDDIAWEMPPQSITLTRDYYFDRLEALAASRQEEMLRRNMQQEMARLILDRIRASKNSLTTEDTEDTER